MYNDYYLSSIDSKLNNLNTIIQNQNEEIAYLKSGDIELKRIQEKQQDQYNLTGGIILLITGILLFNFIVRCWK